MFQLISLTVLLICLSCQALPNDIQKCRYADQSCILNVINDIFQNKYQGHPGLGLPSIDPMFVESINAVKRDNFALDFKNIKTSGISKGRVYNISGFNRNPQGDIIEMRCLVPKLVIQGDYNVDGRALILPIKGNGKATLVFDNFDIAMKYLTKKVDYNGKTYMQIDKASGNFKISKFQIELTNLFNGNKALGDAMNTFLNQNGNDIFGEIKPTFVKDLGIIFKDTMNKVFKKFPYNELRNFVIMHKSFLIFISLGVFASCAQFPNGFPKCRYGDGDCIVRIMNDIVRQKTSGYPPLGIPSIEPIFIDSLNIKQGGNGAVNLDMNIQNAKVAGLSKVSVIKVTGFNRNPDGDIIEIRSKAPQVSITGKYSVNGKILILPIQGAGDFKCSFDNMETIMKFKTRRVENKGKIYMQVERVAVVFQTSLFQVEMKNLFNGNKALGDAMNRFIKENWKSIFDDMKPSLFETFGGVFKNIMNKVFSTVPYDEMFLQ
ncbi:unnamed protein product [Diamesa tonsa]